MTDQEDAARLAEVGRELPAIDVDATTAALIARRARDQVGRGRSPLGFIEPAIAALLVAGCLIWSVLKALEALGG